ncbi:MAG: pseudouridine synthase [Bacteroidales bacterium]
MIHYFSEPVSLVEFPERFTFPFNYIPHELCCKAVDEVKKYIRSRNDWADELSSGKMFGVLIVRNPEGRVGYLAAYSGIIAHSNNHDYFVPAVFDMLSTDGYFKTEEAEITEINHRIAELERNEEYAVKKQILKELLADAAYKIKEAKEALKIAKSERELKRKNGLTEEENASLIRESQFQKAELKRLERLLNEQIENAGRELTSFEQQITDLKSERKSRSAALQKWLFDQFDMSNACGEKRTLSDIFAHTSQKTPPAGAGECAGPKLLQYAYRNGLKPLVMAEFWWGDSPKTELRIHGNYYPACKGKCEPILKHMMIGLNVDPDPLLTSCSEMKDPDIVFEDEWLVIVDKPAGFLSVPGKMDADSVYQWAHEKYPDATGPMIVHRLDMATSGLLIIAKTKEVHQKMQAMFKSRDIKKGYVAILDGVPRQNEGEILLPLCPDPLDRPRQTVSYEYGKPAHTCFRMLSIVDGKARVAFSPLTGRTHQLRVHAAHGNGLNVPILGDNLYGRPSDRLYLHAERLEFIHPVTHTHLVIEAKATF